MNLSVSKMKGREGPRARGGRAQAVSDGREPCSAQVAKKGGGRENPRTNGDEGKNSVRFTAGVRIANELGEQKKEEEACAEKMGSKEKPRAKYKKEGFQTNGGENHRPAKSDWGGGRRNRKKATNFCRGGGGRGAFAALTGTLGKLCLY